MQNMNDLFSAAAQGDLAKVKHWIEQDPTQVNWLQSQSLARPIDVAAQHGQLEIIKYLVSQQADLNVEKTGAYVSLLYWICQCKDNIKRTVLLNWLREDDRYQQLGDNIQIEHLDAASGKQFNQTLTQSHGGLLPFHYAALVNNSHIAEQDLAAQLSTVIGTGSFQGLTLAWMLADNKQWDLLKALAEQNSTPLALNAHPLAENHPEKGITLAWLLALNEQWDLLKALAEQSATPLDLNAHPLVENHYRKGITLAWLLANNKQWDVLKALDEKNPTPFELNAHPLAENHCYKGITLAWMLAASEQSDLLKALAKKSATPLALNAQPLADPNKGITLAWTLAAKQQWDLLKALAEKSATPLELNTQLLAENHPNKGITLAWLLAFYRHWDLLKALAEKSPTPLELNTQLLAENHPQKGITLAWWLTFDKQWDLLKALAEKSATPLELNAHPLAENHDSKGTTLAWILAAKQQWDLLKALAEQNPTPLELNAHPLAENHPNKGTTLAWWLAFDRQWDVLKALAEKSATPLELNAHPLAKNHFDKGTTLAWLLAFDQQWDVLKALAEKSIAPLDLIGKNQTTYQNTLVYKLIQAEQWTLLENLFEKHLMQANGHEYFNALIAKYPEATLLHDFIKLMAIKYEHRLISGQLSFMVQPHNAPCDLSQPSEKTGHDPISSSLQEASTHDIKEDVAHVLQSIDNIDEKSIFYTQAQEEKAHMLLQLLQHPELAAWVTEQFLHKEIAEYTRITPLFSAQRKLYVCCHAAFMKAKNENMSIQLLVEMSAQLDAANKLIQTPQDQFKNNATESNNDIPSSANKRQKTADNQGDTLFYKSIHRSSSGIANKDNSTDIEVLTENDLGYQTHPKLSM